MATLGAARRLARFVIGLTPDAIPASALEAGMRLALDTLGNALAACRDDFGRAAIAVAERLGGPPESTVLGGGARVATANAVLANATLAHGLDFDDTREDAIVHTGCVAVTAALAAGEAAGARGREVLAALVAGVEVMCRVGLAVPGAFHARHFHPTAITGASPPPPPPPGCVACPKTRSCAPSASAGVRPPASSSTSPTAPGPSDCIPAGPRMRA